MSCFLNKSDILILIQKHACSERERDQDVIPITDVFLLGIMVMWGATIDTDDHPGLAYAMATQIMDLRHDIVLEPDSIPKFLVCSAPLKCLGKLVTHTSLQALVAMVRPPSPAHTKFNQASAPALLTLLPLTAAIRLQGRTCSISSHPSRDRLRRAVAEPAPGSRYPGCVPGPRQHDPDQARLLGSFLRR